VITVLPFAAFAVAVPPLEHPAASTVSAVAAPVRAMLRTVRRDARARD
jgi:hypothetical protein